MRELITAVSKELSTDRSETEGIVAALLGRPRFELYLMDRPSVSEQARVSSGIEQMKTGVPIEYITQKVQFRDHMLSIHPGVFIPRIETEYLVELIRKSLHEEPARMLEIGTGCGALSIALAFLYPNSQIVATDISRTAIENARKNVIDFGLVSRVDIIQCDVYDGIKGAFDLIVSNPPYIPRKRLGELPRSVREFEPIQALAGGEEGVDFVERLIDGSHVRLSGCGVVAIEIDDEAVSLVELILKDRGICSFSFHRDLFGRWRYLFIGVQNEKS
jgi:release factor glutamine methyltransferase